MSSFPDAWTALRGRPWRFLGSAWPWRSLAYLGSAVVVGLLTLTALVVVLGIGLLTVVVVVGVLVLAGVPRVAAVIAALERRRLGLVQPSAVAPPEGTLRERLRAGRGLPVAWSEVGYAVLLATVLWVVDAVVLTFVVTVPAVLLLAPVLVRRERLEVMAWQIDSTGEALVGSAFGVLALAGRRTPSPHWRQPRPRWPGCCWTRSRPGWQLRWPTCAVRGSTSWTRSRPSVVGSSATCTTACSSGWWRSR